MTSYTACVDCQLGWGVWSDCSEGMRVRSQLVVMETVGAGIKCPEVMQIESEGCYVKLLATEF